MRSIQTLIGTAVLGASLALATPVVAQAATPQADSPACTKAVSKANAAEAAYRAALADYKKTVAGGGHPGKAEQDNLAKLKNDAALATSDASRVCRVSPTGTVHAGIGSTSQGTGTTGLAAGAALIGAAGIGTVAVRRRRGADRA